MKKTWQQIKAFMRSIKLNLTALGAKKITIFLLAFVLIGIITYSFLAKSKDNRYVDALTLVHQYDNQSTAMISNIPTYTTAKANYSALNLALIALESTIGTTDLTGNRIDHADETYGAAVSLYQQQTGVNQDILLLTQTDAITYQVGTIQEGLYSLGFDFYDPTTSIDATQFALRINDELPFSESQTLTLPAKWTLETTDFPLDRYGNDIQPKSVKNQTWTYYEIHDYNGLHPGLYQFHLKTGDTIRIEYVNNLLLIGQLYFVKETEIPTYQEYLEQYSYAQVIDDLHLVSARDFDYRSDPTTRLRSEQDPSNAPYYHTQYLKLNVIFGDSWEKGGQTINYQVEVAQSGFYHLTFKYRQYRLRDMSAFRKISVNGSVPYDELEAYAFPYTTAFINRTLVDKDGEYLKVYLEAGVNDISLEAVSYPYREMIGVIQETMSSIQSLALQIKRYTSGSSDLYRDWDVEQYFPTAQGDMYTWSENLKALHDDLKQLSTSRDPSELSGLLLASTKLKTLADQINRLPARMAQFSDGDASVNQILANVMQTFRISNIELANIQVHGDVRVAAPRTNIFTRFWEGTKQLFLSFVNNQYAEISAREGQLTVWVNYPRQYIEIMQNMIDSSYDGELKVTLSQMNDQNKLILANASGAAPDIALGIDHWIPYDFAVRGAALDLRKFSGYGSLVQEFTKGAIIPYVFEDGVYALPETQNFWVTYYRKDILDSIGITDIPQTWDEIIAILPILQSYGLNYFIPLSQFTGLKPFVATLPFIYQFGGDLYTENGMQTAINSEKTLEGIKMMSDLYTLYNIPEYVASFYNHFRYGMLPIGIGDLSTYILLETAAVELNGLWGMDLHPGYYDAEKDEIVRYMATGGKAAMIMGSTQYPQESWDFLNWWLGYEVQAEFAMLLQSTYGKTYFWNTANLDAFAQLSIPEQYKSIILEQLEWGMEASRIPGSYMVEREISNAWTKIVFDGVNARQALDEAVRISNREILYKMAEFGYTTRQGEILKSYRVPTIYNIDDWLTEVTDD